jgi:PST family polysaccharide transporter
VLGAKFLLAVLCIAGAMLTRPFTHHVAPSLALFWASTIFGVCQGINMLWYFQGLERMRLASILEISGKVLATLSIFLLVHKPSDGWKVMAAQCVGCVVAHGITVVLAYREVGFQWPTPASVWDSLRLGTSMFLFRAVQSICGSANRLILGSVAPVAALGEYAGAERITRVFQQGMWPVNQALYPRLNKQMQDSPGQAMKTVKYSLLLLGGLGMIFGLAIYLGAPLLVHFVLGPRFGDSVPVLRVFSLWIPMIALTTVMIFQLLLPNQLDNQFNFVNYSAGGLGIVVALLLVPRMAAVGIAWAAVASQAYTLVAFTIVLWRTGLNPFSATASPRLRAPSVNDLAVFSGMDHQEAPVEFERNEPEAGLVEEKR